VLVAFCLPLFLGLGRPDLETDEAIYSFAVTRMLEIGDWLAPKLSPTENNPFLEKPPLKFWIVAAPIKAGLLPHDEFGMRFWDAVAAGASFLYVLAIGSLLAGPVCGAVAVLILFVHYPLIFDHGVRTNNMEATLLLTYCGGVYHFLRWAEGDRRRRVHAAAVGVYFAVGFMVKFVAALFLPMVLGLAAVLVPRYRARALRDWSAWLVSAALAAAIIAPWFVYAQRRFGDGLWQVMFGTHVMQRFTGTLVVEHRQPWSYYFDQMYEWFSRPHALWLVIGGFVTLIVLTIVRRSAIGVVLLLWAVVPTAAISFGTSKLYHYAYPFLPPIAIAGGYAIALMAMLLPAPLRRLLERVEDALAVRFSGARTFASRPAVQAIASAFIWAAAALAIWAVLVGQARLSVGGLTLIKSSGVVRPLIVMTLAAIAARRSARAAKLLVVVLLFGVAPVRAYAGVYPLLLEQRHPLRSLAECVMRVDAAQPGGPKGLYVDTAHGFWHPIYYYFRQVRPWTRVETTDPAPIDRMLHDPAAARPMLIGDEHFAQYSQGALSSTLAGPMKPPMVELLEYKLLLPGPYAVCSSDALALKGMVTSTR
jgi:4-amino-4-deoxy-L-arabinose transferase-like glycosyltransferase